MKAGLLCGHGVGCGRDKTAAEAAAARAAWDKAPASGCTANELTEACLKPPMRIALELTRFGGRPDLAVARGRESWMGRPSKYPVEIREQAVELVRSNSLPFVRVAGSGLTST